MTNDRVVDLCKLTEVSITKVIVKGEKLMTDSYKKQPQKSKGQCKEKYVSQKSNI